MEEERLAAIARDREKMEEKIAEEKKLKEMLKEQMLEIRAREAEVSIHLFLIKKLFNSLLSFGYINIWAKYVKSNETQ